MAANKGKKAGRVPRHARPKVEQIRTWIYENLPGGAVGYMKKIAADIEEVPNPAMRARLRIEFMQFFMPKLKAIEVQNSAPKQAIQLNFVHKDGKTETIEANEQELIEAVTDDPVTEEVLADED
jgi:hypothetical protein